MLNLINNKDLITLDLRTRQIRYLKDYEKRGEIFFIDLSSSDVEGYIYLIKEDYKLFLETLKEDIRSFLDIDLKISDLKKVEDN
jgi:hypothetical protein